jgi:hypothetical protein
MGDMWGECVRVLRPEFQSAKVVPTAFFPYNKTGFGYDPLQTEFRPLCLGINCTILYRQSLNICSWFLCGWVFGSTAFRTSGPSI